MISVFYRQLCSTFVLFWILGRSFMCQSIFCWVLFRPSDPVPQTHTGGDSAASTLLVSVAGRSMNRLWHKMAAVGSMCTEAAQVQLASVFRYQRRQAEELLSPGPTGWTSRSRSYFPPLSLETLSLSPSPSMSLHLLISLSLPRLQLCLHPCSQGNLLFPTGLFVPLLRWHPSCRGGGWFHCSTSSPSPPGWNLLRAPVCLRILKSEWLHGC